MPVARTALCLTCRVALAPREPCDGGPRHKVVRLAVPVERAALIDAVWGPPHLRGRKAAKVGGAGGGLGGLVDGCSGCSGCEGIGSAGELGAILLVIAIAAFAAIALWWITSRIVHAVRARRARDRPRGAKPWHPREGRGLRGTIVSAVGDTTPVSGAACAAWGVRLRHGDAVEGDLMLRDGGSAGLEIALDDGRRVRVPAGRLRLEGPGQRVDGAAGYVRRVDPHGADDEAHPAIPHDRADELRVAVGDAIEVLGAVEPRPDPDAAPAGYREAAASLLVPVGVPKLLRLAS